jgi:hypothetical protein
MYYLALKKNAELAELIGVVLGDGNLYKHPRTENLRITLNSKDRPYIYNVANLIKVVFHKAPSIIKRRGKNAVSVSLYQGNISQRIGIPLGNKIKNDVIIPSWIFAKKKHMIKCLKGLFETDGCFQKDDENYAQYIEFKNNAVRLRKNVFNILTQLGFHPQNGRNYIRLARKGEVFRFKKLINFRNLIAL